MRALGCWKLQRLQKQMNLGEEHLKKALFLVLLFLLAPGMTFAADRPNILWLVSEDNNPFLGCYGDPLHKLFS